MGLSLKGDSQMSKKAKQPSTPESRAEKLANKQMLRKVFSDTFFKAFSICLAILLVVSVFYIATVRPNRMELTEADPNAVTNNVVQNNNAPAANNDAANAPATPEVTELTADSTDEQKLAYFNTAINKVKPNAKTITLNKEVNSQQGSIEGSIPKSLVGVANSLISSNMGEVQVPPAATSAEDKNKIFPVENESWSSKLTMEDVQSIDVADGGDKYTITVLVKPDEPSATTAHGAGHNGKAFSVILTDKIMENAGGAKSMIKDVKTGHKDGKIVVTVDKATGNVLTANYYFVWTLSLNALGIQISIPFGLDKQFTIAW